MINQRIKDSRKKCGLTQQEVGDAMGIARQIYIRIESGERELTCNELLKLCKLFNVSSQYILNGNSPKNEEQNILELYGRLSEKDRAEIMEIMIIKSRNGSECNERSI